MGRTAVIFSLTLLLVLSTASPFFARTILNPNQISGHLRSTNQNPEILDVFDEAGLAQGMSNGWVRADSVDVTTVNFEQSASVLDIRWVDGIGAPISVQGGATR